MVNIVTYNSHLVSGCGEIPFAIAKVTQADCSTTDLLKYLVKEELEIYLSYQVNKKQVDFLLGRIALKMAVIAMYPHYKANELKVSNGLLFQPVVQDKAGGQFCASLAHADGVAVAVCSDPKAPMTVDIERIKAESSLAIDSILNRQEREIIKNSNDSIADYKTKIQLWTFKEALSKFLLSGLGVELSSLAVSSIFHENGLYTARFKYFHHVKGSSVYLDQWCLTLVHPHNTDVWWPNILIDEYLSLNKAC